MSEQSWTDDRIDEARDMCADEGMTAGEVDAIQAWLLGALLSHFDPDTMGKAGTLTIPQPLSPGRWREYVRRAIAEAS